MPAGSAPFATFLIIGPTCFFLGIIFANFPYDYNVLWTTPPAMADGSDPRAHFFDMLETHLKFLHASPPLISRILHIVIATGLLGFLLKLYKPSEANLLFDGASLVLYMVGITVYIANIVKGLRTATADAWGDAASLTLPPETVAGGGLDGAADASQPVQGELLGRDDSLRVLAASNTILGLVLVGVLVLQAGQWYAQRKEAEELEQIDKAAAEKRKAGGAAGGGGSTSTGGTSSSSKKKQ